MPIGNQPGRGMMVGMGQRQPSVLQTPNAGPTAPFQFVDQSGVQPPTNVGFAGRPGAVQQAAPPQLPFGGMGVGAGLPGQFGGQSPLMARLSDPSLSADDRLKLMNAIQLIGPSALQMGASGGASSPMESAPAPFDPNLGSGGGGGDGGGGSGGGDGGGGSGGDGGL